MLDISGGCGGVVGYQCPSAGNKKHQPAALHVWYEIPFVTYTNIRCSKRPCPGLLFVEMVSGFCICHHTIISLSASSWSGRDLTRSHTVGKGLKLADRMCRYMTVVAAHRGSHPPCHCSKLCHPLEFSKSTELRPNITVGIYTWQEYQQSSAFQTCEETRRNFNGINYGFRSRRGTCSSSSSSWYYCYNSLRLNKYLDKLDTDWVEWSRRAGDVVVVVVKERRYT